MKRLILQQNKYTPKERKKEFPYLFLETLCSINLLLNSLWIKTLAYLSDMQVTTAILVPWLLEIKNSHLFSIALGSQLLYCYNIKLCDHCPTISSGLQKKATIEQNSASILLTNVFLMALVNGCVLWAFLLNIILWWVVWSHIIIYSYLQNHFSEPFWLLLVLCAKQTQAFPLCSVWTILFPRFLRDTPAVNLSHTLSFRQGVTWLRKCRQVYEFLFNHSCALGFPSLPP